MDPLQATMAAILIVKEIRQYMEAQRELSDEELIKIVLRNTIGIESAVATARAEMEKYKGGVT